MEMSSLQKEIEARSPFNKSAIAVRFIIVVDWVTDDGTRWVSRIGSEGLTCWEREGLLHHALNSDWSDAEDVGSEDEKI